MIKEILSGVVIRVSIFIITALIIGLLILAGIEYGIPYIKNYLAQKFAEIMPF